MNDVTASLQYLAASATSDSSETTPIYHASQAGNKEEAKHEGQFEFHNVTIHDARHHGESSSSPFSVDREGFQLVHLCPSSSNNVQDFYKDREIKEIYENEIRNILLTNIVGAKSIYIFDHTRRASTSELRMKHNCREPSSVIHNDYTELSATQRLFQTLEREDLYNDQQGKKIEYDRFSIINLWRSIGGVVKTSALALCDSTSIDYERDLVSVKRVAKDRIGQIQFAKYHSNHKWYYYPNMTQDEVILIKTYDSSTPVNRYTIHTSFDTIYEDSNCEGALSFQFPLPPRQSIETRAFVFYE